MSGGADKGFSIDPTTVREWKRYPEYTDSGVAWFGEVPAGWELKRLKHISTVNDDALSENTPPDYQILYVDISDVDPVKGIQNAEEMTFEKAPSRARRLVRSGDVIVSTVRTYLRAITPIINPPENLIVSTGFAVIRTNSNFDSKFAGYTLRGSHFIEPVVAKSKGVSYPAINASELVCLEIPLPPLPEQHAIAAFLDRETARIDALIAKKQRFIELLEEKRQALITQAVTKGLDPDVEMKDSGVEWLGEVPVGWEVVKNGILIDSIEQGWSPLAENRIAEEDEWAVIKLNAVSKGRFYPLEHKVLSTDYDGKDNWKINTGDFLITRSNTPDLVGDVCLVDSIGNRKLIISDLVYKLNYCLRSVNPLFMKYWMLSKAGRYQIVRDARGSSRSMVKISQEIVKSWYVLLPPLPEQHAIATFLDRETAQIDTLINAITRQIEKLHEYRTALISAAVTGKIDVRGEVPADP